MSVARAELLPVETQERVAPRKKPRPRQRKPSRLGPLLASALTWLFGCAFAGAAVMTAGVFMLAGLGWSLITVGVFLFAVAGLLRIGITHG